MSRGRTIVKPRPKRLLLWFLPAGLVILFIFSTVGRQFAWGWLSSRVVQSPEYWLRALGDVGIYAALALSLNVILGQAGLFNMGHAAFFAIGAYTTAILNLNLGWPILATMLPAGLMAGLFALMVARPIIHLRGDYLLVVTIGIMEIVRIALTNNIFDLTGGSNGLFGISRPVLFGFKFHTNAHFFFLIWAFTLITVGLFFWLERSRFGRALKFLKEDPIAAEASGVNTNFYKLAAFTLGAFWAGMTGTIYAARMQSIAPSSFTFNESVLLFVIVILGGSGSIRGVILGAFLVIGLPELFRDLQQARFLVFGAALVAMMIFRPQGLLPPRPVHYRPPLRKTQAEPGAGS